MITINADSLASSIDFVRKKGIEAKALALKEYRSKIYTMYIDLLHFTPQYSGDMVFNWDIVVGEADGRSYQKWGEKEQFGRGSQPLHEAGDDSDPLERAKFRGLRRLQDISYFGQPVYFVNASPLDIESPVIINTDDGSVQELRDGVVVFAWLSITSYLQERYGGPL